jgi:DNA-binding transcriptional LysR family regulator
MRGRICPAHYRLKTLENAPFILFQKESRMGRIVQAYLDGLNFGPRVVMRSGSAEAIKAIIRAGLGISVLFLWNINTDLHNATLATIRTEVPPPELRMALVQSQPGSSTRTVQEFVAMARRMNRQNLHLE